MALKWPWPLQGQNYRIYGVLIPSPLTESKVRSTAAHFPDNWRFGVLLWDNGEFEIFEKKSLKIAKSKFSKIQQIT